MSYDAWEAERNGKPKKLTGFRALYYHYPYLLGKLGKPKSSPRKSRYLMNEIIKLDRYMEQFNLLWKYRIDTESQLHTLEEAVQADLDALTTQRTDLYRKKRKDPDNEPLLSEIESINRSIRGRRRELRICARIEVDIPRIHQKTSQSRQHLRPSRKSHRLAASPASPKGSGVALCWRVLRRSAPRQG